MFSLSQTSKNMMVGVHPDLVRFMEELIGLSPHDFKITCGMRTAEEQNKLYQYGRTIPGTWRTNCDGYKVQSNHQENRVSRPCAPPLRHASRTRFTSLPHRPPLRFNIVTNHVARSTWNRGLLAKHMSLSV